MSNSPQHRDRDERIVPQKGANPHQGLAIVKDSLRPYYNSFKHTQGYKKLNLAWLFGSSYYKSRRDSRVFQDVKTFCMFIGHGRSGHSVIGALLDAHSRIILADEADVLEYVSAGFSRNQIYHLLLARSRAQARRGRKKSGREGKVYSYQVPGQWQGRFGKLQVIGASKAGVSIRRYAQTPALLQQLQNTLQAQVKFIHVVRNPYDNISTMSLWREQSLEVAIERYFANCETIIEVRKHISSSDMLLVRQEDLISQAENCLDDICRFLGIESTGDYLSACASIVYKTPAKSRHKVTWSSKLIDVVKSKIDEFDFLEGYSYEA